MDEAPTPIRVTVNGDAHEIPPSLTVDDLLDRFGLDRRHTAVERNRVLVPRAAFSTTEVESGDVLEIVTLVGGG
ncbi:MAG: sulfur carrier protein ThiS [Planctomycetota bacterium]|nr:sulfur carrier protein ThiS [Planctomycetota bacterium]MDA0935240.1 sulfur carrier protein ThiS [Planctomycetota bacterium]MDA1221402.1 sulfur carrier protein ThiS [Planctomycetota bacterium]